MLAITRTLRSHFLGSQLQRSQENNFGGKVSMAPYLRDLVALLVRKWRKIATRNALGLLYVNDKVGWAS